jgi:hypothetical protein
MLLSTMATPDPVEVLKVQRHRDSQRVESMQAEVRGIASQAGKVAEMAKRIDRTEWKVAGPAGAGRKWQGRTPAMAAGLTDRRWELREVLVERLPPERWKAPRRQRRRRKGTPVAPGLAA